MVKVFTIVGIIICIVVCSFRMLQEVLNDLLFDTDDEIDLDHN